MSPLELFKAEVERRQLGEVTANEVRFGQMNLPLSAVLADLQHVPEADLPDAVDRAVDTLEQLGPPRPFRFRHFFSDPGLNKALDAHTFPGEVDIAPGLQLLINPNAQSWWNQHTGSDLAAPADSPRRAARWMLDRVRYVEVKGVHEFSGPHALAALLALGKQLKGATLAVVLDERRVWLCGEDDPEALEFINQLAIKEVTRIARSGGAFIGELYRQYDPGELRRWLPPEGHPLRGDFTSFRRIALRLSYELHCRTLKAFEFPMVLPTFDGPLDAPLTALCAEAPCAIPAVERVVFEGLPPIPFFGLRAMGLLEPLPLSPWWRVNRVPTKEEAIALGHVPQRWFDEQPL